jgi:uncharacterized membrane protein YdjX (TVP38/TMEM64 family)
MAIAALAGWIYWIYGDQLSRQDLLTYGEKLPPVWFIVGFLILPLAGVPISVLLVLAGIRFGMWGGMILATGGVFFHHLVAYQLVRRWFRYRFRLRLQRAGYVVPVIKSANLAWYTILFAAIHGPPYSLKLYLLALTDIPFRIYFWVGAPVYILFCLVPVGAGSAVMQVNTPLLYGIVVGITLLVIGMKLLEKRFNPGS